MVYVIVVKVWVRKSYLQIVLGGAYLMFPHFLVAVAVCKNINSTAFPGLGVTRWSTGSA